MFCKSHLKVFSFVFFLLPLSLLVGCGNGSKSLIKNVTATTEVRGDSTFVSLNAQVYSGGIAFPSLELPVSNPRTGGEYGAFVMHPDFEGNVEIGIQVNLTEALKVPGGMAVLPNGSMLPLASGISSHVVSFQIGNTRSVAYVGAGGASTVLGVALPISQFDQLANYIGGLNLFPSFHFSNGIQGVGGIFTGTLPGTNGLAIFADIGSILNPGGISGLGEAPEEGTSVSVVSQDASFYKKWKVNRFLKKLSKSREEIHLN